MKIYITRHSKTLWNEQKRLQGRLDSPLTKEGIDNAYALKKHLSDYYFDYIYSSPIYRAYHSAKIIFENNVIKDDRLCEMNFGDFEGRFISELLHEKLYHDLWHNPGEFTCINNGESYEDVIARAKSFINDLTKLPEDSDVMIVTHGMFFIVLLSTMLGYNKSQFTLFNQNVVLGCSLTCVSFNNNEFHLEFYNDTSFLPHVKYEIFNK